MSEEITLTEAEHQELVKQIRWYQRMLPQCYLELPDFEESFGTIEDAGRLIADIDGRMTLSAEQRDRALIFLEGLIGAGGALRDAYVLLKRFRA